MPKATNKQINYLNKLASENYDVLSVPSAKVTQAVLKENNYESLSELSKEEASLLINLLSGASKYQALHLNITSNEGRTD